MTTPDQIGIDHIGPDDFAATLGGRTLGYVKEEGNELTAHYGTDSAVFRSMDAVRLWFAEQADSKVS